MRPPPHERWPAAELGMPAEPMTTCCLPRSSSSVTQVLLTLRGQSCGHDTSCHARHALTRPTLSG
jgi:hypothetical protein